MFREFLRFELKYRLGRPATYIYFGIFFLMTFLATTTDAVVIGGSTGNVFRNSPYVVTQFVAILSIFGIFVGSAVMGVPVYRDLEHKTSTFYFSLPFTKTGYLLGRFSGSFLIFLFIMSGVAFGNILGRMMPWVDTETVGPFVFAGYLNAYLYIMIPNLLFIGLVFFSLVIITRSLVASYTGSAILFVTYLIANTISNDIDNRELAMLIDAFGLETFAQATRYWTVSEKNTLALQLTGMMAANRLIWLSIGGLLFAFAVRKFSVASFIAPKERAGRREADKDVGVVKKVQRGGIPEVRLTGSHRFFLGRIFRMGWLDFRTISRDILFLSILLAGFIFLLLDGFYADRMYGTTVYPVTFYLVEIGQNTYNLIAFAVLIFFSGELVWRERRYKLNQITDALPAPNWVYWGSKFIAMVYISLILGFLIMLGGMLIQTTKGYFQYEVDIYLREVLFRYFPRYVIFAAFCFFIHTVVNNKFLGFFLIILIFMTFTVFLSLVGWAHPLYRFLAIPGYSISAMNGYGHFYIAPAWLTAYWAVFAGILIVLTHHFWIRGTDYSFKNRWKNFRASLHSGGRVLLGVLIVVFAATGGYIYYNTNVLNTYRSETETEKLGVEYERKYRRFEHIIQPRITNVHNEVDIYPYQRKVKVKGNYWMKNKSQQSIDSVHILSSRDFRLQDLAFSKTAENVLYDSAYEYRIYHFNPPLAGGDSVKMDFELLYHAQGFSASNRDNDVVYNGTFFNSNVMPKIGYDRRYELSDKKDRRKYGLPENKDRLPAPTDSVGLRNSYISSDADWIDFETIISTELEQTAVAPGYLQGSWTKKGRRYFYYLMDSPILNFYSYLSADYELLEDSFESEYLNEPVKFQIFYQKGHEYNLDRMKKGAKLALDYCSKNFYPYQHSQARILEFPRYATFAQSFPNTIPFSEGIGFIARLTDTEEDEIDMPFYVTAHEIAHQWWGHMVASGTVKGMTVMSESMSQYVALMVMEKVYGEKKMRKFLEYEMDRYLFGRSGETVKERPLLYNENQSYIHYRKGSVVMYALKDYLGEDTLNAALKRYVNKTAFKGPPYTNSLEFISYIKEATPDSLQYLVEDMFEKITLYENRCLEASAEIKEDSSYEVRLEVDALKMYADTLGREEQVPMQDYVEIGIFREIEENGEIVDEPLYLKKHLLQEGEQTFTIQVREKPDKAGIDPLNKLIDRNPDDNVKKVAFE